MNIIQLTTDLSLSINKASSKRNVNYVLSGELHAGPADADVAHVSIVLSYKKPGSSTWVTLGTVTTGADGRYTKTTHGATLGTWTYRAKFAATAYYTASSAQAKIKLVK
jgi:5-hydroxyisourate hydrolase-like protein (transthyretin family)